ncbi:MAG: hypothetical protein QOF56_3011, partial [Acidobacteriaceae bacterium]|nr:hypothetical protein [Acidobacteriaceae bacterium]
MTNKLRFSAIVGSLALAYTVSAQQIANPLSNLAGDPIAGSVLCRGGANVPMTVDAEQALPLKLVAQLDCGQPVSLLSSTEGYTVKVRTADGKSGYVAWMSIAKGEVIVPTKNVRQPAVIKDGKARWLAGTEGSQRFYSEGLEAESLTVNGVTVQVSLQDTGWKLLANIAVANGGLQAVHVVPSQITLVALGQVKKSLPYQQPQKLRTAVNHQILWTEADAAPSASGYLVNAGYRTSDSDGLNRTQNYLAQHQVDVESKA